MTLTELLTLARDLGPHGIELALIGWLLYRLGKQDAQLEWQSRVLDMMARKGGSDPPPRPKLATLRENDPWDGVMREANKRR